MANQWTDQQIQAIQAEGGDLLIAAAAGSGKTAVLVERIITRILEQEQEIDRLLVVTFTKAAASEMSQRIGAAIAKRLEKDPDNLHLQNQMAFLPRADIKTIHAFCLQVIKEYYHVLELDPSVRTADPAEIALLQKEVLEDLFETFYADQSNLWFFDLLETFSTSTNDAPLRELVLDTYTFAQGSPHPKALLDELAESLHLEKDQTLEDCVWFPMIRRGIEDSLEYALYQLKKAYTLAEEGGIEGYRSTLENEIAMLQNLQDSLSLSYAEWRLAYLAIDFVKLPAYRGEEKMLAERIKALRGQVKKNIEKLEQDYFSYSEAEQTKLIQSLYPVAKGLSDLTKRFMDAFAAAKREKNIIDFNDYEHFALQILLNEDGTPTTAAKELRQRYDEIMIDEYQDSNIVQELVLAAVSGESVGKNNRFMVGDVKQSIYRFRQAMPELFNAKYLRYPAVSGGKERKIVLSKNFRSRKKILDGVNFIFRQIMQRDLGDISYDAEAALYAGTAFPPCEEPHGGANEILLIETQEQETSVLSEELQEMDRRQVEATAIAGRIRALMESGYQVLDQKTGTYRPLRYGDIAILLRSIKNWGNVLEDVFGREGIPYYGETAEGYFETPEVETVLSLLRLIDNPRQDIPLLSILHSPIYDFSADALMQVRLGENKGAYLDCMYLYLQEGEEEALRGKISAFLGDLESWRKRARDLSLHELLRLLYRETGYYDYLGMTAGGDLRQANLQLLLEKAEEYETGSHKGLFYFIRYAEDMKTAEKEASAAKPLTENEERVHVMTIHKSKGLEFPVVFISDIGKRFNEMDVRSAVLFHQKWGCGMNYTDIENRVVYRTLAKQALSNAIREENMAEEIRVLYVAMTRAKEKLILTGTVNEFEKAFLKWEGFADCKTEALSASRLRRANSYLDWVMPAILRHPTGAAAAKKMIGSENFRVQQAALLQGEARAWKLQLYSREKALQAISKEQKEAQTQKNYFHSWESPAEMTEERENVYRILSWQYPYGKETRLPAKLSISEIKRKYQEEVLGETLLPIPKEMKLPELKKQAAVGGAKLGTAMHVFMEEANLRQAYTMEEIEAQARELVQRGRLTQEEAGALRKKELLQFFRSSLAERLRKAEEIETERPFSLLLQPKELFFGEEYQDVTDQILVNGIIDCYFIENGKIVLLDYKSDRVYTEKVLRERYQIQLALYRTALERAFLLPVQEVYLYSFAMGKAIPLEEEKKKEETEK